MREISPCIRLHRATYRAGLGNGQPCCDLVSNYRFCAVTRLSDKPPNLESYNNSKVWASDIDAVIKAKSLKRPLIVGWSYGGLAYDVYSASL
jgi:pimeloyl-ACP methyl ester carboxylesterase